MPGETTPVALTDIRHGYDEGGENKIAEFKSGEEVKGLPNDVMRDLIESGAIVSQRRYDRLYPAPTEEEDDLIWEDDIAVAHREPDEPPDVPPVPAGAGVPAALAGPDPDLAPTEDEDESESESESFDEEGTQ